MNIKSTCKAVFFSGIIALSLLLFVGSTGAAPYEEWNISVGETGGETGATSIPYAISQTSDGGYIVAGVIQKGEFVTGTGWLFRIDIKGNLLWNRTFGGEYFDELRSVSQTQDGGFIIAGYKMMYKDEIYGSDFWLIKVDANGSEQWNRTFGEKGSDIAYIVQQSGNGYVIAGERDISPSGESNIWFIGTDENGSVLWDRIFGRTGSKHLIFIGQTLEGGFMLGVEMSGGWGGRMWLISTDNEGNKQWDRIIEENGISYFTSAQKVKDGYILLGYTENYTENLLHTEIWLIKADEKGDVQWKRTIGERGLPLSLQMTEDGGYIIASYKYPANTDTGIIKNWLIKTDENGNVIWDETFGEGRIQKVMQTSDGGYVIIGWKGNAQLIKVSGEVNGTQGTPDPIPGETQISIPSQTLWAISNETKTVLPPEKVAGFEVFLAIPTLLLVITIRRNKRK